MRGVNVFREVEREFATGDRLQFTVPNKDLGVANRDLGTIVGLENGSITVQLDGKFPRNVTFNTAEFRQFDHGYAVTSHSSQGLTAGRVLANIDTDSSRNLINTRLAYVTISRAADDARVYTNNAETLGERLASDITKTAAHDLALGTYRDSDLPRHEIMSPSATKSRIPIPALREIEHEGIGIAR